MARVAVAFVEIRPDLEHFSELLTAELAKVKVAHSVQVKPEVDKNLGSQVAKALKGGGGGGGLDDEVDEIGEFIGQELGRHISENFQVDDDALSEHLRDAGRSMNDVMDLLGEEATEAFVKGMRRKLTKRMTDEMSRTFTHVEEEEKIHARLIADLFADNFLDRLKDRNDEIGREEAAHLKRFMLKEFGQVGLSVADRMVNEFNRGLRQRQAEIQREAERLARETAQVAERTARAAAATAEREARDAARRASRAAEDEVRRSGRRIEEEARLSGQRSGRGFADTFANEMRLGINLRLGQILPIVIALSFAAAPLAGVLSALAAAVTALVGALGESAVAAAGAFTASLVAMGQALATATTGFQGFGDAVKAQNDILAKQAAGLAVTEAELERYQESLALIISPYARDVVGALGRVSNAFIYLRRNIQWRLFKGVSDEIDRLAKTYLPVLDLALQDTARMLNKAGLGFGRFLRQASTVDRIRDIMAGNTTIAERFSRALIPLADAALTLLRALQPLGLQLAGYARAWAEAINKSVGASESSGNLLRIVNNLQVALDVAVQAIKNLWGGLSGTFRALLPSGRVLLDMFQRLTARWNEWVNSVGGRNAIAEWGWRSIAVISELGRLMGNLFRAFSRLGKMGDPGGFISALNYLIPPLEAFLAQLSASGAAQAFALALGHLFETLTSLDIGGALASIITNSAMLLEEISTLLKTVPYLSSALRVLFYSMALVASVKFITALTGLGMLVRYTGSVITLTRALFGLQLAETAAATGAARFGTAIRNFGLFLLLARDQVLALVRAFYLAGAAMVVARGNALGLAVAIRGIGLAFAANPVGAIVLGLTAIGAAIYGLSQRATDAEVRVRAFNTELANVGAGGVASEISQSLTELNKRLNGVNEGLKGLEGLPAKYWQPMIDKLKKQRADIEAEMAAITNAADNVAVVYGSTTEQIISNLRVMGLQSTTSSAEIVVAMRNIVKANNGVPVSAEMMTNALASIYNVMGKNYGVAAEGMNAISAQIAAGYAVITDAALDSAEAQVQALLLAAKATGKTFKSIYYQAQILGIRTYRAMRPDASGGSDLGNQYAAAIGGASGAVGSAAAKVGKQTAAGFLTSLTAELRKLNAMDLVGKPSAWVKNGLNIAKYIAKGITSGAGNIYKVGRFIARKFPSAIKKVQSLIAKYKAAAVPFVRELGRRMNLDKLTDLLDQIKDFKQSAFEALTPSRDLVSVFGFIPTPAETRNQLQLQLDNMRAFTTQLEALQAKGLSRELAKAWLQAGAETAGNLVQGLQDATPEQIAEINRLYDQIGSEASAKADAQASAYYGIGQATVEGYIKGIASMQTAAVKEIQKILDAALAAAKKKLGIRSPSSVFGDMGVKSVLGYILAVESKTSAAVAAVNDLYGQVTAVPPAQLAPPTVRPGYAHLGQLAGVTPGPAPVNVRVFLGDKEITDILRVQVDNYDTTRARALLVGRRGG